MCLLVCAGTPLVCICPSLLLSRMPRLGEKMPVRDAHFTSHNPPRSRLEVASLMTVWLILLTRVVCMAFYLYRDLCAHTYVHGPFL